MAPSNEEVSNELHPSTNDGIVSNLEKEAAPIFSTESQYGGFSSEMADIADALSRFSFELQLHRIMGMNTPRALGRTMVALSSRLSAYLFLGNF